MKKLAGLWWWCCILVLNTHGLQQQQQHFFAPGEEWTFSYEASVQSGTHLPAEVYSGWSLQATITIQAVGNTTTIWKISSLKPGLSNGSPREWYPPLPAEATPLLEPFVVSYASGRLDGLNTSSTEPLWSINMKRGIAGVLQLSLDRLSEPASLGSESNIYGDCREVKYSLETSSAEELQVLKLIDHARCHGFREYYEANVAPMLCPQMADEAETTLTKRLYRLQRRDAGLRLLEAESRTETLIQPLQAKSEAHTVVAIQKFKLTSTAKIQERLVAPAATTMQPLSFVYNRSDFSMGRATYDQSELGKFIDAKLDLVVASLDSSRPTPTAPDLLHNDTLSSLLWPMGRLTRAGMLRLYLVHVAVGTSYRQETKRNVFFEVLPRIGTSAAALLLKDLLVGEALSDYVALNSLMLFPFYVHDSGDQLLAEMEALLHLGDRHGAKVKDAAVLGFATLVYRTFAAGQCSQATFERYALIYFNRFSESDHLERRMLYVEGLKNLQLGSVVNYLEGIAADRSQSDDVRLLAVWASMKMAPVMPEPVYKLYWPIMTNRSEPLEMRVASLFMLMVSSQTRGSFLGLFWYMSSEPDPFLYNIFYDTIHSLQDSTFPCYQPMARLSAHLVRYLKKPAPFGFSGSGNYILDYINPDLGFGAMLQTFYTDTRDSAMSFTSLNSFSNDKNHNEIAIYVKIKNWLSEFHRLSDAKPHLIIEELLLKENQTIPEMKDLHFEFILMLQDKTVFFQYLNSTVLHQQLSSFKWLLDHHLNYQSLVVPLMASRITPTELGTPLAIASFTQYLISVRGNLTVRLETAGAVLDLDLDLRCAGHSEHMADIYSPVLDTFFGVDRELSIHGEGALNASFGATCGNASECSLSVQEVRARGKEHLMAAVVHSETCTYVYGDDAMMLAMKTACPDCNASVVVAGPNAGRERESLVRLPLEMIGVEISAEVFDCEDVPYDKIFTNLFNSHKSNDRMIPIAGPIMWAVNFLEFLTYSPPQGSCGLFLDMRNTFTEPTVLNMNLTWSAPMADELKLRSQLVAKVQSMKNASSLLDWNATLHIDQSPWYLNNSLKLVAGLDVHKKRENEKFLIKAEALLPKHQSFLTIEPVGHGSAAFRFYYNDQERLRINANLSASNEQKLLAMSGASEIRECRAEQRTQKYLPYSKACLEVDERLRRFRDVQVKAAIFAPNSSTGSDIDLGIAFPLSEPKMNVGLNSVPEKQIDLSRLEDPEKLAPSPRLLDLNGIEAALSATCAISASKLTRFDGSTEEHSIGSSTLLAARCSSRPDVAVVVWQMQPDSRQLSVEVLCGDGRIAVSSASEGRYLVEGGATPNRTLEAGKGTLAVEHFRLTVLSDDTVRITCENLHGEIYYTPDHIVTKFGEANAICGACRPPHLP